MKKLLAQAAVAVALCASVARPAMGYIYWSSHVTNFSASAESALGASFVITVDAHTLQVTTSDFMIGAGSITHSTQGGQVLADVLYDSEIGQAVDIFVTAQVVPLPSH